jgi:D-alanyl-D-alanine carboxypeptidase (penicillin-binding protein 5/6)
LYKGGDAITTARIWKAADEFTSLGVLEDLYITVQRGAYDSLESVQNIPEVIIAPVAEGQPLAELKISLDGEELLSEPLRALADNPSGSIWQRTRDSVSLWFE